MTSAATVETNVFTILDSITKRYFCGNDTLMRRISSKLAAVTILSIEHLYAQVTLLILNIEHSSSRARS